MAKFWEDSVHKGTFLFRCPGCEHTHVVNTNPEHGRLVWEFNGDLDKPTVSPSLLYWIKDGSLEGRCHSIITNGRIEFQPDCGHKLAGQTVDIPEF
jgi:hypothetical protein